MFSLKQLEISFKYVKYSSYIWSEVIGTRTY